MNVDLSLFAGLADSFWCVAFLLGLRHGVDADHLAAIDAMARLHAGARPRLARNAGVLFSSGHAAVVLVAALLVSSVAQAWQVPPALRQWGSWMSAATLMILALLNIAWAVRGADGGARAGWRGALFGRLLRSERGWMIAAVGALFALSFDTLSIASLLGLGASGNGGWQVATMMSAAFFAGMLVTDGLNGLWIAALLRRTGSPASAPSRRMAGVLAAISAATAVCSVGAAMLPQRRWLINDMPLLFSSAVMLLVLAGFMSTRGWRKRH